MSTEVIISILSSAAVTSVLASIISGLFTKRKLGADATQVITQAASGVVTTMQKELQRRADEMEELRKSHLRELQRVRDSGEKAVQDMISKHERVASRMIADHEAEMADVARVLELHVEWDRIAIEKMSELNVSLPPAPPLMPELRSRVRRHPH